MKKSLIVFLLIGMAGFAVAQDPVSQLSADLETLFVELGKDMMPGLETAAVLNHELGSAEFGNLPHMYFSLSVGATAPSGTLTFLDDESKFDNPELFDQLLEQAGDLKNSDYYSTLQDYFPYPSIRAVYGIGLFSDYELSLQAGLIPQSITDMGLSMGGVDEEVTAEIINLGFRLRRVLVHQDKESHLPAISAGIGYIYSGIDFGYSLDALDPLDAGGTDLVLAGTATFKTTVHSFGTDVRASGRFLRVFYPFLGASAYYQKTSYEAGVAEFTINGSAPNPEPFSSQEKQDVNLVINTGFDMKLLVFNLFLHGNYAVSTRAPGAILGMRLQF